MASKPMTKLIVSAFSAESLYFVSEFHDLLEDWRFRTGDPSNNGTLFGVFLEEQQYKRVGVAIHLLYFLPVVRTVICVHRYYLNKRTISRTGLHVLAAFELFCLVVYGALFWEFIFLDWSLPDHDFVADIPVTGFYTIFAFFFLMYWIANFCNV